MAGHVGRVKRVHNPHFKRSGLKAYGHALRKYSITPTKEGPFVVVGGSSEDQSKAKGLASKLKSKITGSDSSETPYTLKMLDSSGQPGDVPAEDMQHDREYLCEVDIGTPAQKLMLDFDTGSSDLWVWSTELPARTRSAGGHTAFDPSKSSTFQAMQGSSWKISYGDGSNAHGNVGTDQVNLGGLIINNQAVELAQNMSAQFISGSGDGLLGLAWDQINTVQPKSVHTPVANMIAQKTISSGFFAAHLANWQDDNNPSDPQSFYNFGYLDEDVLAASGITDPSQIWYTPVNNKQGFWSFQSTSTSVNGHVVQQPGNTAIADTGTSLAMVSDSVCEAIYSRIPGAKYDRTQQGFTFPRNTPESELPDVQFDVGGKRFSLVKENLAYADLPNGYVYGGVQSRGNLPFDILGDSFLKSVYAIFDEAGQRFGAVQRT